VWITSWGFRAWRVRPISQRHRDDLVILVHIREQQHLSLQSYGRPRMTEDLQELGLKVGHRRIGRLMRENSIEIAISQKYKATMDSNYAFNIAPNLLDPDFSADGPNQKCPPIDNAYRLPGDRRVISRTFGPARAGSIWQLSSISIIGASLAGPSAIL
jgi:transposase InsO family protein